MRTATPLLVLVLAAGCFNPKLEPGFRCGAADPGPECPDGLVCIAGTCEKEDGTPPGSPLGPYGRVLLAPLGDGVVAGGLAASDLVRPDYRFSVQIMDPSGTPVRAPITVDAVDTVEPDSLSAAGAGPVAVFAGVTGDRVHAVWVTPDQSDPQTFPEATHPVLATTFSSADRACVAWATTDQNWVVRYACRPTDGATIATIVEDQGPAIRAVAGAVSPLGPEVVAAWATDSSPGESELYVKGPDCTSPIMLSRGLLPPDGWPALRLFYSPVDDFIGVAWRHNGGIQFAVLNNLCEVQGQVQDINGVDQAAGTLSRADGGSPEVWQIVLAGKDPIQARVVMRFPPGQDQPLADDPPLLQAPRAITDGNGQPWLFYYAAFAPTESGVVMGLSPSAEEQREVSPWSVAHDYAVAPRRAGGFFLAYRADPDEKSADNVLDAYVLVFGPDGRRILP